MTKSSITAAAFLLAACATFNSSANAQNAILAEMYGRGVHAFYSGDQNGAYQLFSMAIDNGSTDPRAYYFRGLVANTQGRQYEAEADWQKGAELEASGGANPAIGRSLARFQGSDRLKLEQFRQTARLQAMATAATRSKARYGEIEAAESEVLRSAPKPPVAAAPATPPIPPAPADDNPFADDMAVGEPKVDSPDVLKGAMDNPFGDAAAAPAAGAAGGDANPFGGAADAGADPFGGPAAGAGADPFGGSAPAADAGADPFGGGADSAPKDDPFGGDPFGN